MALWIFTIGNDVRINQEEVEKILSNKNFPWNFNENPRKDRKIFRNMNLYSKISCSENYMSQYKKYLNERKLMEEEFSKAEFENKDYIIFTTNEVIFETCRAIIHNKFKDDKESENKEYGGLVVITNFNHDNYDEEHICGWFDQYGHMDDWPSTENDISSPVTIILSELLCYN